MQEQTQSTEPIVSQTSDIPVTPAKSNRSLVVGFAIVAILLVAGSVFAGIQIGKKQTPTQQPITAQETTSPTQLVVSPTVQPTANITTNPIADWKIYNSPEIGDYVSPFQLRYPLSWTINQKLTSEEPKSLTVTLTNSNNETIQISQGMGGGGTCVYDSDSDYATFDGMGQFFSSYTQLDKPTLWRISQYKDKNETSHVVCEKSKDRYIDGTRIGWISVNIQSEASMQEVTSILENIVFKPSSETDTLFD